MHLSALLTFGFALLLAFLLTNGQSDDSPGFFLKMPKNVPRLGRRSDKEYDSYFLKNMKAVPRIGRRNVAGSSAAVTNLNAWLGDFAPPLPIKRALMNPAAASAAAEREYSVVQPVNSNTLIELLNKDAIPSDNVKFVHWKDFDRALLFDTDLYAKVISLGRKPDQRLKADLSFGGFIPLSGSSTDGGNDFMLYNGGEDSGRYDNEFLHYNHLK